MATYYNHCQVGIVDASGNVNVIYPQTYASDVKVGTANKGIGIDTSSTVQSLITALGTAAIKNVGDLVTNSASSASTTQAYSCAQINSKLTELNSKIFMVEHTVTSTENANKFFEHTTNTPSRIIAAVAHRNYGGKYGFATGIEYNVDSNLYKCLVHFDPTSTGVTGQLFYLYFIKL